MKTVFIDGQHGTVGLKIREKLQTRKDLRLVEIPEADRRDPRIRKEFINGVDLVIFCLPDEAEREAIYLVENQNTKVISTSTVFRTAEGWTYGLPELFSAQRQLIKVAKRVANPGCYPTGFISILRPLVFAGVVPANYPVTAYAITGYSGGGKKMIEEYEGAKTEDRAGISSRPKNLSLMHKHLPEMMKYANLNFMPNFLPIVGDFYQGMLVHVPLISRFLRLRVTPDEIRQTLAAYYHGEKFIKVMSQEATGEIQDGFLSPLGANGTNNVEIFVFGNTENMLVVARLDNLGKGAAGNTVQNMNLMLAEEESLGL